MSLQKVPQILGGGAEVKIVRATKTVVFCDIPSKIGANHMNRENPPLPIRDKPSDQKEPEKTL